MLCSSSSSALRRRWRLPCLNPGRQPVSHPATSSGSRGSPGRRKSGQPFPVNLFQCHRCGMEKQHRVRDFPNSKACQKRMQAKGSASRFPVSAEYPAGQKVFFSRLHAGWGCVKSAGSASKPVSTYCNPAMMGVGFVAVCQVSRDCAESNNILPAASRFQCRS